jgi:predicted metalloprotease
MRTDGQRRSSNFEDRGSGAGRGAGGGIPIQALAGIVRLLGLKGTLIAGVVLVVGFLFLPAGVKQQILSGGDGASSGTGADSVCQASQANAAACDFSLAVLGSTEDVWTPIFARNALPNYGASAGAYRHPTLVVYGNSVSTGGCGDATSAVGPFYCPGDEKLYIDPSFYTVMEKRLRAPGDFAQAYVIAHEVGHHVQNLLGIDDKVRAAQQRASEAQANQLSVRMELQADCLAGVWGHYVNAETASNRIRLEPGDVEEGMRAAAAIGDDAIQRKAQGRVTPESWTHGSSEQRVQWLRRGLESGKIDSCNTLGS